MKGKQNIKTKLQNSSKINNNNKDNNNSDNSLGASSALRRHCLFGTDPKQDTFGV